MFYILAFTPVLSMSCLPLASKERFKIHRNDVNNGKVRCGVENQLFNVCHSSANKFEYLQVS